MKQSRPLPAKFLDLDPARQIGELLIDQLDSRELISRAMLTGDVRRQSDTVNELSLVVIPLDPEGVVDCLRKHVPPMLQAGNKLFGYTPHGLRVTVTMTDPVHFGGVLLWETGSGSFLRMLGWKAASLNLDLQPDGLYADTGLIAGSIEDHIFTELGVEWLDPAAR